MLNKKFLIGVVVIIIFAIAGAFFALRGLTILKPVFQRLSQERQEKNKSENKDSSVSKPSIFKKMLFGLSNPYDKKDDIASGVSMPSVFEEMPFGLSNPYDEKDDIAIK